MSDDLNLGDVKALSDALSRVDGARELARLVQNLGLWTKELHKNPEDRQPFPTAISDLSPGQLSDLSARVAVEMTRAIELLGLLNALDARLKMRNKAARARARATARRAVPKDAKMPTKAELDDLAEDDPVVAELEEQLSLVHLLSATAAAAKEASQVLKETVSREITYRSAQLQARVY